MKKHKTLKIVILTILIILVVLTGSFIIWANDYYKADDLALNIFNTNESLIVEKNHILIKGNDESKALIFYPGAKVEYISYLPIIDNIVNTCGISCILVKMPLNMAIFNKNVADDIIDKYEGITTWYIGGHSMGGAMASSYASSNQDKIEGLILLGAYLYGDYPVDKSLTIYGSYNDNLEENIDYTKNIIKIEGGNHAQFGNYGKQIGDKDADISSLEQQNIAVCAIKKFLNL